MSHSHLILEERIVIELFVHRGMSCRKIATHLGRHHTTVSRELRRNSSKKRLSSQTADRCPQKRRKMPRHYRCLIRTELVARIDEKLRSDWSPEQIAGEFAWIIHGIRPCASAGIKFKHKERGDDI
ncbi:MAG: transposase [Desulfobulbus sp.]|jgi:IS30 family transposase